MPRLVDGIVARRRRPGSAVRIGIVLGMHDWRADPAAHAAQSAAAREWARDPRVEVIDPGMVAVDGGLADGGATVQEVLTRWTDDGRTDAAILISADDDHLAAVADIRRWRRTHLEVARWEWQTSRLWQPGLWVHHLDPDLLGSVTSYRDPRKAA